MSEKIEGGCRCGAVRYSVARARKSNAYACHCRDCQTWSGSAFSMQFIVPEDDFALTGTPHHYERPSQDGTRISHQYGCAKCLTRVYNTNTRRPGMVVVRAGTLDRSDELAIVAHIWTKRKMAGVEIPAGMPQWEESAPPEDFATVLTR
ncbi:MAG TPA: GFA family protein [Rhizomicrobium sp.]|nr:GFA family protein [Rhizomicrobium sp.]